MDRHSIGQLQLLKVENTAAQANGNSQCVYALVNSVGTDYLAAEGPDALGSVGCYRLEGPGAQLFSKIEGDYFTILGLPLMGLLDLLRRHGALNS